MAGIFGRHTNLQLTYATEGMCSAQRSYLPLPHRHLVVCEAGLLSVDSVSKVNLHRIDDIVGRSAKLSSNIEGKSIPLTVEGETLTAQRKLGGRATSPADLQQTEDRQHLDLRADERRA